MHGRRTLLGCHMKLHRRSLSFLSGVELFRHRPFHRNQIRDWARELQSLPVMIAGARRHRPLAVTQGVGMSSSSIKSFSWMFHTLQRRLVLVGAFVPCVLTRVLPLVSSPLLVAFPQLHADAYPWALRRSATVQHTRKIEPPRSECCLLHARFPNPKIGILGHMTRRAFRCPLNVRIADKKTCNLDHTDFIISHCAGNSLCRPFHIKPYNLHAAYSFLASSYDDNKQQGLTLL